jgi:DNA oxidative demethylase
MQANFFAESAGNSGDNVILGPGALLLRDFLGARADAAVKAIQDIAAQSPFRHMSTPGGFRMSVAMTNCGTLGWVTDRKGYRYSSTDPENEQPWPAMPPLFRTIAVEAAARGSFANFQPDACLINRYEPGARMTLHQDKDELDMTAPIVSVSLGLPATFQWGGANRKEPPVRHQLSSGDVVVWGGPSRLNYHGVAALKDGNHPLTGSFRYNLTFRKALK